MTPKEKTLYAVFSEVRTCFNQLKMIAEQLHQDLDVNPSMRAVMEALAAKGPQTVPDIAKQKGVSRQHIQTIMNALQEHEFVESFANPAHKRSPLFNVTEKGESTFAEVVAREKEPLRRLAADMSSDTLESARGALTQLNQYLAEEISKGEHNETSS